MDAIIYYSVILVIAYPLACKYSYDYLIEQKKVSTQEDIKKIIQTKYKYVAIFGTAFIVSALGLFQKGLHLNIFISLLITIIWGKITIYFLKKMTN